MDELARLARERRRRPAVALGGEPRASSSSCKVARRGAAPASAPVAVAFGPPAPGMSAAQIMLAKEKLAPLAPDVAVEAQWAPAQDGGVSVVVASAQSSADAVATAAGLDLREDATVLQFDKLMDLLTRGGLPLARSPAWWRGADVAKCALPWAARGEACAGAVAAVAAAVAAAASTGAAAPARMSTAQASRPPLLPSELRHEGDSEWEARVPPRMRDAVARFWAAGARLGAAGPVRSLADISGAVDAKASAARDEIARDNKRPLFKASKMATTDQHVNLNMHITEHLIKLSKMRDVDPSPSGRTEAVFRARAYQRAAAQIKTLPFKVEAVEQIKELSAVGRNMLEHIDEILRVGFDRREVSLAEDAYTSATTELTGIFGIGPTRASELYRLGIRRVEELVSREGELTELAQKERYGLTVANRIGLRHFYDFKERIPRAECEEILDAVRAAVRALWPHKGLLVEMTGSYRRGAETCGDVDLLISPPSAKDDVPNLELLVDRLRDHKLMIAALGCSWKSDSAASDYELQPPRRAPQRRELQQQGTAGVVIQLAPRGHDKTLEQYGIIPKGTKQSSKQSFMGVLRVRPGMRARRVDIKVYPREMLPFALIYFTGDQIYNMSLRGYCKANQLCLNDEGLFLAVRTLGKADKEARGVVNICPATTEREVVEYLGFPYLEPPQRDSNRCGLKPELLHVFLRTPWQGHQDVQDLLNVWNKAANRRTVELAS
jgi:DNA polymerase/3'-5' exonuclease PolX